MSATLSPAEHRQLVDRGLIVDTDGPAVLTLAGLALAERLVDSLGLPRREEVAGPLDR